MVCGYEPFMMEGDYPKIVKAKRHRDALLAYIRYLEILVAGAHQQEKMLVLQGKSVYHLEFPIPETRVVVPNLDNWIHPSMKALESRKDDLLVQLIMIILRRFPPEFKRDD